MKKSLRLEIFRLRNETEKALRKQSWKFGFSFRKKSLSLQTNALQKKDLPDKTTERPPEIFDGLVGGNQKL